MRVASTFAVSASGSAIAPAVSQQRLHHRYLSSRLGFSCRNIPTNFTTQPFRTRMMMRSTTNLDLQGFGIGTGTGTGTRLFEQQRICCCQAMDQTKTQSVYQGVYGSWTVDPSDVREVISYRTGLVTAAASFVAAASTAFLPAESYVTHTLDQYLDLFFLLGASGLGVSLFLIHIYVTEIKRTLQALWALGIVGSLLTYTALAQPAGQGLVHYVVDNPTALWFVGPLFASLTGLVFKEGLCYGKLEAGILTFIIPTLLLGHLTGVMDEGVKLTLLGLWMALFIIFAGRKFTQPVKDDIGDKSVFMFNALPEKEKAALLEKLEQQKF